MIVVFCHFTVLELYGCMLIDATVQKVFTAVIILKNMMFIVLIPKKNAPGYFFKILNKQKSVTRKRKTLSIILSLNIEHFKFCFIRTLRKIYILN